MDWEWYKNPVVKSLFFHCMLRANYEDSRFEGMEIKRGEFVTSYQHLADETGLTVQNIRTALKKLERSGEITVKSTNKLTVIKCCNYSLYQDHAALVQQTADNQTTDNQQSTNKPLTTINNNNNKNKYNNYYNKPKSKKSSYQRLKCTPSFDIEEIQRRTVLNDDFDI